MAKVKGGITGRPAGKVASLIFGAARSREGKVVTVRELVAPSNPRTADQQKQRSKFQTAIKYTQEMGPDIYQSDWNRAVGQLPGFQGLMSIFLNNLDGEPLELSVPTTRQLGNLHYPDTFGAALDSGQDYDVTWSTESGPNGTNNDQAVVVALKALPGDGSGTLVKFTTSAGRGDGSATVSVDWDPAPENTVFLLYFRGEGAAEGSLSEAKFFQA